MADRLKNPATEGEGRGAVPAEYRVFDEATDIWRTMERRWREIAGAAIEARGRFTVALSGGRTPVGFYCHLSRSGDLPWDRTEIFQVDERFVSPESDESNARMIRSSILRGTPVPAGNVHLMDSGMESAERTAGEYESVLRGFFSPGEGGVRFDLVLLGIGEDGHTASLFPGTQALSEEARLAVSLQPEGAPHERITLTLPVINGARNVFSLATGRKKAAVVAAIRDGREPSLPAARVRPRDGRLAFYLDRLAGAGIEVT